MTHVELLQKRFVIISIFKDLFGLQSFQLNFGTVLFLSAQMFGLQFEVAEQRILNGFHTVQNLTLHILKRFFKQMK